MKAAFFTTIATMALSAFAAPVTESNSVAARQAGGVQDAVNKVDEIVTEELGVGEIADAIATTPSKRQDLGGIEGLISTLTDLLDTLQGQSGGFQDIADQVNAGDLTPDQGADAAIPGFQDMHYSITEVVTSLTGAAGLTVADGDVDTVLNLVVALVSIVLANVKVIVTVTGLQPQLISLLHSVFSILSSLLILVIGLVSAILPGLIAALTPLLAGLGNGLLVPVLTPIVALLASISLPTNLA
ncbi:hypothetical protein G7Z17_g5400 [Cylindrodendrum hubeiense]|uniref:Uncharacterized protein n=1 Tax=Cylindrodendrum hubeiense TaxID=595255 RepID=A0A9P5H751_9HYPO|nr:hypothetical protein G7Z17_g5400 [Cylindrodendrum hubeiense]